MVRRWFSGRMLASHASGPGSIPGRRKAFFDKQMIIVLFFNFLHNTNDMTFTCHLGILFIILIFLYVNNFSYFNVIVIVDFMQ